MKIVLTIAGSDPSGGAGIQQDLRAITAMGCYGASVITALTSQNTCGVSDVMAVPADVVKSQLDAVLDDLDVSAVKIGQIPSAEVAEVVVQTLTDYCEKFKQSNGFNLPIVCDPVMISTSGRRLMGEDAMKVVVSHLFPLCTLVTPNIPEFEVLSADEAFIPSKQNLLVKGGHAEGVDMADCLYLTDGIQQVFSSERITTNNLHGTGCALSSAIASALALGDSLPQAVQKGKAYVTEAIRGGVGLGVGHGNGPVYCTTMN